MEKQISSNNIRIALFEEQNKKLRHSIEKLTEVNQQFKTKQVSLSFPTWLSVISSSPNYSYPTPSIHTNSRYSTSVNLSIRPHFPI